MDNSICSAPQISIPVSNPPNLLKKVLLAANILPIILGILQDDMSVFSSYSKSRDRKTGKVKHVCKKSFKMHNID